MKYKLRDLITIKHGFAFSGEHIKTEDNGVVLVTPGNFRIGGGFKEDKCKFFDGGYSDEYVLHSGDLVVTMTDLSKAIHTLGYSAIVPQTKRVYLHNQRIGLVRIISDILDKGYLYWFMRTPKYQKTIAATSSGSTVHHTSPDRIRDVEIDLPDIETQKKVAGFLFALDDKIKLNNRINENLEQQAEALYYNQFGSTTHTPTCNLSDICQYSCERILVSELTLSTYYSTENMQANKAGAVDATSLPSIPQTTRCHKGDVLVSNIRPYFKKIIYVADECGCSTDVLCFTPKRPELSAFLFETLYGDRFFDYMVAGSKGTKMPRGDKQQIMNYPVVIPSNEALKRYNNAITPMLDLIASNRTENTRLIALRDTLLPKLMSGELDVSEIYL